MIARPRLDESSGRVAFGEARRLMLAETVPVGVETLALEDAAGRIVAQALRAEDDIVPFARSAMDGYAVRAADTRDAATGSVTLRVAGSTYAGESPSALPPRSAIAIATGAPLPAGADAVVRIEDVAQLGTSIAIGTALRPGDYVFPPGDDARRGEIVAQPGDVVTPGRAALLAAAGCASIVAYRRPRVAVVCTGDEIVPVDARPRAGQVRNSNATMLAAQLRADGAEVVLVAQAADSADALRKTLADALSRCDLLVTTGGASVGARDLVKGTLVALGARFAFRSVALRPSKPTGFGRAGTSLVAVLPGNPAAAFVGYVALVRGVVRRLAGRRDPFPAGLRATLRGRVHARADRHYIVFGRVARDGDRLTVEPLDNQCSSLVRTSADANSLIVLPPGDPDRTDGATVEVEVFDWDALG
ncbi:MAG TPA: gephyrin-like molybdotransferase Glp [Candidatus Elarobacter sp.]|nr:gephyrin-like molybdotransferase Glp [Candidatus Elarobacter sp.]